MTTFDGLNRSLTVTEVGGAVTSMAYGGAPTAGSISSFQTKVKDPAGVTKRTAADRDGRLIEV